jgi:hypothetical protein
VGPEKLEFNRFPSSALNELIGFNVPDAKTTEFTSSSTVLKYAPRQVCKAWHLLMQVIREFGFLYPS